MTEELRWWEHPLLLLLLLPVNLGHVGRLVVLEGLDETVGLGLGHAVHTRLPERGRGVGGHVDL